MSAKALALILGSVALSAIAQIMLKMGMGGDAARQALTQESLWRGYLSMLLIPAVAAGLAAYGSECAARGCACSPKSKSARPIPSRRSPSSPPWRSA